MRRAGVRAVAMAATVMVGTGAWAPYGVAAQTAAAEPVDLGGEELPGGSRTDAGNPIRITAGLWADVLGTGSTGTHYFRYERTMEDSTVHVGVVGASAEPSSDGIEVVASIGDAECARNSDSPNSSVANGVFGAFVAVGAPEPGEEDSECLEADELAITVSRSTSGTENDLPIAIKVVEEAPVPLDEEDPGLPPPVDEVRFQVPEGGPPDDVAGGTSFDDSPLLDPVEDGVTVATEIPEGEERLFRVPVGWEQQVVAAVRVPEMDAATEEATGGYGPYVSVRIVEPTRNTIEEPAADESSYDLYGVEPLRLSAGTRPLRYLNRFDGSAPTLPGDYWVAVAVERFDETEEREPLEVPVELTVAVAGEAGKDAPSYPENVRAPGAGATPAGYRPDTPYLVGDGQFAAVASGNPVPPDDRDDSWWDPRRIAGLGLGAVSLACCAVGAVWLARRRPR